MPMNISKSQILFERSKALSPGGVHSPVRAFRGVGGTPRFIARAQGSKLFDVDGNSYIDFCNAWGPMIFGHQDAEIREEVEKALSDGWSLGTAEPYSLALAELVHECVPAVEKIRFVNSGTEAVMSALRVARAATGRNLILKFDGCYHGHVDSMLVRAGSGLAEMASPDSAGVSKSVANETLVAPLDDDQGYKDIFAKHGSQIAAVILEPIPANNGLLLQRESWIREVMAEAKRHGSLVIFDEVITGFRVGLGGMAGALGVRPDLLTYGKVIGGGFPVGAFGGRKDLLDLVAPSGPVYQAGTLSANPVAMRAGLAMVKKLKRTNPYQDLRTKAENLSRALEKKASTKGVSLTVQNASSMFWTVFGGENSTTVRNISKIPAAHKEIYTHGFHKMLDRGFYMAPSAFEVSFLSTAHTQAELDSFVEAFGESL